MDIIGAFMDREDEEERLFIILLCGCFLPFPLAEEYLNDNLPRELPCPTHEEHRFTGEVEPPRLKS